MGAFFMGGGDLTMGVNIYDLDNEYGARIITDESTPALQVSNVGTGVSLSVVSTPTTGAIFEGGSSLAAAAQFGHGAVASATIATMRIGFGGSVASGAVFEFTPNRGLVSVTSVVLTTVSNFKAAVRVKYGDQYGWIPIIADAGLVGTGVY